MFVLTNIVRGAAFLLVMYTTLFLSAAESLFFFFRGRLSLSFPLDTPPLQNEEDGSEWEEGW